MDANTIAFIVFVSIVLIVLIFAGIEIGTFDMIRDTVYDLFHPDPGPDLVFKPMEIRVRRCQECNSIITGLDIFIVKDDAKPVGFNETELFEAIYCKHCGHQNIIGKYYRHASDDIQIKAQIARKDSKSEEPSVLDNQED